MDERHDPSACRRILREARENGLHRKLFDAAQELQDGIYRAEALCGLCGSTDMDEEDRSEWVPIIVDAMLEEERPWRLAESIGIIAKSMSKWPGGRARKGLMGDLIGMTGGLPNGDARVEALKAISSRVSPQKLPELFVLAVENHGMEAKAARPVMKAIVESKDKQMIAEITPILTESAPDLAVKFLDNLHRLSIQSKLDLKPSALEMAIPFLEDAEFETVRTLCSHLTLKNDVVILSQALDGNDEDSIRFAVTLAGRADRAGDSDLAAELLEKAATNVVNLDERTSSKIKKNISKGFERLGLAKRAEEFAPVQTPQILTEKPVQKGGGGVGHTLALVGTYDGSIGTPHLRALARAAGIAWGFGLDIALIDWPTDDIEQLCEHAQKESGTAGVSHLPSLLAAQRLQLSTAENALSGSHGHPIATTHQPRGGSVNLNDFDGKICMFIGLGRQGLPKKLLDNCQDQFELTGVGASLETAVAMGAIAQRLADLN